MILPHILERQFVVACVFEVFVWTKVNVEFCLVVFLVSLVAQCTVRSAVNVSVEEGNFPVL